jgi:hypothetical protein
VRAVVILIPHVEFLRLRLKFVQDLHQLLIISPLVGEHIYSLYAIIETKRNIRNCFSMIPLLF